ncbi:MAG TPA: homoserine kinase [Mycobacteriales bacterium]|nr:homoserine kinase [Mycobacteriales bacterium]
MSPRFRSGPVHVRVPATSANLGPGFDSLGLALSLRDDVVARVAGTGLRVDVEGEGADRLPRTERHLVVRAARAAFDLLGGQPAGLELSCVNRVPHDRGLGSSAAAIVAGMVAARALVADGDRALEDAALLAHAAELEGHPDNVAACLLGGLTIAWQEPGGARAVTMRPAGTLRPIGFVPPTRSSTIAARGALPVTVSHADAAWNAGRAALLVHALTREPGLLLSATEDRLHQTYRAAGMPESARLVDRLRSAGIPAVMSGAGPTVLAFADSDADLSRYATTGWNVLQLAVDNTGAELRAATG